MKISQNGQQISRRFFQAIEALISQGRIGGLQTFALKNGHDVWHLQMLKNGIEKRVLKPEYIYSMCSVYGVSPEWIILGTGTMFNELNKDSNEKDFNRIDLCFCHDGV